jgi:hypothetical protein
MGSCAAIARLVISSERSGKSTDKAHKIFSRLVSTIPLLSCATLEEIIDYLQ